MPSIVMSHQRGHVFRRFLTISFVIATGVLLLFTSHYYAHLFKHVSTPWQAWSVFAPTAAESNLAVTLPEMWKPYIHNLTEPSFHADELNKTFKLPKNAHPYKEHMGKRVLILDVDTRLDLGRGAILNKAPPRRETMKGRTAGIMNHLLYALVHGYDYRLVRAPAFKDRHGTWVKVPIIKEALKTHDVVIFLDSDAIFEQISLPIEWLMSYYRMTPKTLVAMAEDPYSENNADANKWVMWNTGFIVAQNSSRTQDLFQRWLDCPKGERYPDCRRWAYEWAHEQAAFANHVRYDYKNKVDIRSIGCNEGNGMPGHHGGPHCNGDIIRHYWFDKDTTVKELYEMLSDDTVRGLHKHFHENIEQFYVDASTKKYPLKGVVI